MPGNAAEELRDFHRFLTNKLNADSANVSPEEALDEWRRLNPQQQVLDEDLAAIQEALDEVARGNRGTPFDEFIEDFRKRHNLPA
jgi:hypothetical protein